MIELDLQLEQELEAARSRYPIGDHVTGVVTLVPRPGVVGLFVDLGHPPTGFVDLLSLPLAADQWPTVGTVTKVEVLQHTCGQVRLWPLDAAFRSNRALFPALSEPEWCTVKSRHPVGSAVTAEITGVFPSNREYTVAFDGLRSVLPWSGPPPVVGTIARFTVDRHLDVTRRILLRSI
ncbi:hypothetical protein [Nocardia cerradoensis]|uniref:hypothetical protein n=1 Tax=Nocardia cerradoensis TaxID=85688 RepID=UPI0002ECB45A|nr:hypothetical protein [Nocardia cerradoensis]NKY42618.1 hypothetical protein [Nocardia cerradoensis]